MIFAADLREMAASGYIELQLWDLVRAVVNLWMVDTQEIEGANNIIRWIMMLAPKLGWELLCARLKGRKTFVDYKTTEDRQLFVDACVDHHDLTIAYMADKDAARVRFGELDISTYPPPEDLEEFRRMKPRISEHHLAAAGFWLRFQERLNRSLSFPLPRMCPTTKYCVKLSHNLDSPHDSVYVDYYYLSLSYRRQLWTAKALEGCDDKGLFARLVLPLERSLLLELLASYHSRVISMQAAQEDQFVMLELAVGVGPQVL